MIALYWLPRCVLTKFEFQVKGRAFVDNLPVFLHFPIDCENDICSKRLRKDY